MSKIHSIQFTLKRIGWILSFPNGVLWTVGYFNGWCSNENVKNRLDKFK